MNNLPQSARPRRRGRLKRFFLNLRVIYLIPDAILITASLYLSLLIRVSPYEYPEYFQALNKYLPIFVLLKLSIFVFTRLYDMIWRYVSVSDAIRIFRSVLISSVGMIAATYLFDFGHLPRSLYFIDAVVSLLLLTGARLGWRILHERSSIRELRKVGRATLIYGAGENGRTLATRFRTDADLGLNLVGFIDDNPEKIGMKIAGHSVLGGFADLEEIIKSYRIEELIIAMTNVQGPVLSNLLKELKTLRIRPKIMSHIGGKLNANSGVNLFRSVQLEDLLKRKPRIMNVTAAQELVQNKVVFITGAGGSIGSELARQVLAHNPTKIIIFDNSEYNLYQIDQELRAHAPDSQQVIPVLADLKDKNLLGLLFEKHKPEIVFHAAAYKHVHLVELNPCSSLMNNVYALENLLGFCEKYSVENFLLISSDKAVNPVGVMGASKRICELMVSDQGKRLGKRYCSVRFGNVLGSSGSLIPLLTKQIQDGQPITLTHPDMTRFFMLIPEAVSLVLRAATVAAPGDIAILKMGDPVHIVDIAHSLLALMQKTEQEIPIVFTGLRPGEKMFEELYIRGDEIETSEPDILIARGGDTHQPLPQSKISEMLSLAQNNDPSCMKLLHEIVAEESSPLPS